MHLFRRTASSKEGVRLSFTFWKFLSASATTNLADGIGTVAFPLLAASLTSNPLAISSLTSMAFLPWLVFGLPGGALVDRLDRRLTMSIVNLTRAAIIIVFSALVIFHAARIPMLYAAALVIGFGEVLYDSAARAILPQVVNRQQLDAANSWLTVEETLGQDFLGAPAGSALFAALAAAPFIANAVGFGLSGILILSIPGPFRAEKATRTKLRTEIRDGLRWLWQHPVLRSLTVFSGLIAALMSTATSLNVLYALRDLHLPAGFYGLLLVTMGAGGLLGSFIVRPLTTRLGRVLMLPIAAGVGPVMFILLGLLPTIWVAGVSFLGLAAGVTMWNVLSMSLRQAMIPDELLGRVLGAYRVALWGGIPVGALVGGALAIWIGVPRVYLLSGIAQLGLVLLIYRLMHRNRDTIVAAYDEPQEVPA